MAGIAKVTIVGNVGRDPEMRYTPSGQPVTNFSVAVNRRYSAGDGETREETEWFTIDCWGKLAETANQYLQKGKQVYIEGRIKLESWDDRNTGEKRQRMKVTATEMQFLGQRGDAPEGNMGGNRSGVPTTENSEFDNMPF